MDMTEAMYSWICSLCRKRWEAESRKPCPKCGASITYVDIYGGRGSAMKAWGRYRKEGGTLDYSTFIALLREQERNEGKPKGRIEY